MEYGHARLKFGLRDVAINTCCAQICAQFIGTVAFSRPLIVEKKEEKEREREREREKKEIPTYLKSLKSYSNINTAKVIPGFAYFHTGYSRKKRRIARYVDFRFVFIFAKIKTSSRSLFAFERL